MVDHQLRRQRQILTHGGQRRVGVCGDGGIVKANDGDVFRHAAARALQGVDGGERNDVRGGEQAVKVRVGGDETGRRFLRRAGGEGDGRVEIGVIDEARIAAGREVALMPLADFRQIGVAKKRDTAPAEADQVFRRHAPSRHIVEADDAVGLLRQVRAPDDEGRVVLRRQIERFVLVALTDDDKAVGALGLDQAVEPAGLGRRDLRQEDLVAPKRDLVGETPEHLQKERVGDQLTAAVAERDDHPDGLGALKPKASGEGIDDIALGLRDLGDHVAGRFRDQRAAGQRPRDGRDRHARHPRDVSHFQALGSQDPVLGHVCGLDARPDPVNRRTRSRKWQCKRLYRLSISAILSEQSHERR